MTTRRSLPEPRKRVRLSPLAELPLLPEAEPPFLRPSTRTRVRRTRRGILSRAIQALEILGVMPPLKQSPTTGRTTYAFAKTDQGMIALQEHEDPQVQALVAARLGNKTTLEETRTERFIDMSADQDQGAAQTIGHATERQGLGSCPRPWYSPTDYLMSVWICSCM